MVDAGIIFIKLLLGLGAFLLVGYVGTAHDKRIAGVLLTFPILNAIAMLTDADPLAVAQSIYPLVIFNSLLFYAAITCGDTWPPFAPSTRPHRKLLLRLVVWTAIWFAGAFVLTLLHDRLPGAAALFVIALCIVPVTIVGWTPRPGEPRAERHRLVADFIALWSAPEAARRIALFLVCFATVLVASYGFASKWVGMASALPLPGLFALATLSVLEPAKRLYPIRDAVLLGPLLVIPFNWLLARAVLQLPGDPLLHAMLGVLVTLVFWVLAGAVAIWGVPAIAAHIDRWRAR